MMSHSEYKKKIQQFRLLGLALAGTCLFVAELGYAIGDWFLFLWNLSWGMFLMGMWFNMACRARTDEMRDELERLQRMIVREAIKVLKRDRDDSQGADWWKKE